MKLFNCPACGNVVYFESRLCTACQSSLGYVPSRQCMTAWNGAHPPQPLCANASANACNWVIEENGSNFCRACRHHGTVPDLSSADRRKGWQELELAKRRLFYSLLRWHLPLKSRFEDPAHGLIFHFLADDPGASSKVMTGHDNGIITIALAEADAIERERRRLDMGEPYRTLLGHFRHEVGHHYWDILVRDGAKLDACRAIFGDDTRDYGEALQEHYARGAPADWQANFVSAYATTHPWEDFAETWAHYIHIVDTLEMASQFGMEVKPSLDRIGGLSASADFDPYETRDFQRIASAWLPFVFAMNSVNRAMGANDLYPFILNPEVLCKLGFIHDLVHDIVSRQRTSEHLAAQDSSHNDRG
jgi:hypothetical protein